MTGAEAFRRRLADARAGQPTAWVELYDSLAPILHSYLRHQSLDDPEDVAGETLLQVVRDIDRFEGDERQFRSWALAIAHHRMLDARRARRRRPVDPVPDEQLRGSATTDTTSSPVIEATGWADVHALLDRLTDEQREVVVLRVVNELSLDETARVLGRTVGSVKALQHRAFSALRAHLSGSRNPEPLPVAHRTWPS